MEAFEFCKGKKVMLHANYEAFGKVEGGPETVVEAFIELTELILFPTFNFHSWTENHYWDQVETQSERGIVSETARRMIPRTLHPIYSFAVHSDDIQLSQRYLRCRNHEAVETMGSPFAEFYRDNGLIVSIGYESLNDISASVQYAELKAKAPYRRIKEFHGIYKEAMQRPQLRTFSMFVRMPGVVTAIDPAINEMTRSVWGIRRRYPLREDISDIFQRPPVYAYWLREFCERIEWYVKYEPEKLHKRVVE